MKLSHSFMALVAALLIGPATALLQAAPPADLPGGKPTLVTPLEIAVAETVPAGTVTGTLTIEGFISDGGVLKAEASLDATLKDPAGVELAAVTDLAVLLPVISTEGTTPELLVLELGSVTVMIGTTPVALDPIVLEFDADSSQSPAFAHLLKLVDRTLNRATANQRQISNLLNTILRLSTRTHPTAPE